jgi:hypothetical protein
MSQRQGEPQANGNLTHGGTAQGADVSSELITEDRHDVITQDPPDERVSRRENDDAHHVRFDSGGAPHRQAILELPIAGVVADNQIRLVAVPEISHVGLPTDRNDLGLHERSRGSRRSIAAHSSSSAVLVAASWA